MEQVNKNYFVSLSLLIVITFIINSSLAIEFDYKNVDSWAQINPQCGGQRQSPVQIEYKHRGAEISDDRFSKINYDKKPLSANLSNDGHIMKVQFVWDENQIPFLAGEIFGEKEYVLDSIHFHWSRISNRGSEHIVIDNHGALEMHFVHYNREYDSFENALNFTDGLAVIGGVFEILQQQRRRRDNWNNYIFAVSQTSPAVSQILSNVESIRSSGSSVDIEPFAISEVRPVQLTRTAYMSYSGSLTTPPCTENVLWLISTYPYQITEEQLRFLQSTVELDNGDDHNNRPIQPMNNRRISIVWGFPETVDSM